MAETRKDINIVLSAKDQATPAFHRVSSEYEKLKRVFGNRGGIKETFELLKGGAALAGFTFAAGVIKDFADGAVRARDALADGAKSSGEVADDLLRSLPALGKFYEAGRSIRELFTGEQAAAQRTLSEAAAQDANRESRTTYRQTVAGAKGEIDSRINDANTSLYAGALKPFVEAQAKLRKEVEALEKDLNAKRKEIDSKINFNIPSYRTNNRGGQSGIQTVAGGDALRALAAEQERIAREALPERPRVGPDPTKGEYAPGIALRNAENAYNEAVNRRDKAASTAAEIRQQLARYTKDFAEIDAKAAQLKDLQIKSFARDVGTTLTEKTRDALRTAFEDWSALARVKTELSEAQKRPVRAAIQSAFDSIFNLAGGESGIAKFQREKSLRDTFGGLYDAVNGAGNFLGGLKGNGTPEEQARNPNAGPVQRAGIVSTRYVAGFANNSPEVKAATTTATNTKMMVDLIKQQVDATKQTLELLKRGGGLTAGTGL